MQPSDQIQPTNLLMAEAGAKTMLSKEQYDVLKLAIREHA